MTRLLRFTGGFMCGYFGVSVFTDSHRINDCVGLAIGICLTVVGIFGDYYFKRH